MTYKYKLEVNGRKYEFEDTDELSIAGIVEQKLLDKELDEFYKDELKFTSEKCSLNVEKIMGRKL